LVGLRQHRHAGRLLARVGGLAFFKAAAINAGLRVPVLRLVAENRGHSLERIAPFLRRDRSAPTLA
jgi:hypothetical protein